MSGLGDEFRAAREARHLSLSDVSDQIHIRSVYLESIEDGDSTFAAPVYVRGFIRTYARFLGLDPESAVGKFSASLGVSSQRVNESVTSPLRSRKGPSLWLYLAGAAAIALVVFVGYRYVDFQRSGGSFATVAAVVTPSAAASAEASAPAPTPKPAPKPIAKETLEVRVTADSWMSVRIDGASQLEGIVKAGTTKAFHGKNADVRAGNAGGVELTVNGKELGKMGNAGDVVERTLVLAEQ